MQLTQRDGKGNWIWRRTIDGVEQQRSTRTDDKKEARKIAAAFEAEFVRTVVLEGNTPATLGQLVKQYLAAKAGRPSVAHTKMHLNKFSALFSKQTTAIKKASLQEVLNAGREEGHKESYIALTTRHWNSMQNWASANSMVACAKLDPINNIKGKDRFLSVDEEKRLLAALAVPDKPTQGLNEFSIFQRQDNYHLTIALLDLGCRFHEAAELTWSQVDMKSQTIFIKRGKGGTDSTHLMSPRLKDVMQQRLDSREDENHVFPTKLAEQKDGKWMARAVKRAGLSKANGNISIHSLRHTYANRMLNAGLQLPEVQQLLGHKNIKTTMQYIHVQTSETAKKALAAQLAAMSKE